MRMVGRAFPRSDRAPSIVPVAESRLIRAIAESRTLHGWEPAGKQRVSSGFYTSQALELRHNG
jgi:magnesium-protoporphyrin O-methyltransferase